MKHGRVNLSIIIASLMIYKPTKVSSKLGSKSSNRIDLQIGSLLIDKKVFASIDIVAI
jgi:hypothetical protein